LAVETRTTNGEEEDQTTEENRREDLDREKMGGHRGRTEDGKDVPIR